MAALIVLPVMPVRAEMPERGIPNSGLDHVTPSGPDQFLYAQLKSAVDKSAMTVHWLRRFPCDRAVRLEAELRVEQTALARQ